MFIVKIEENLLKKWNKEKLISYGFKKEKGIYKYSKKFMNNSFRADIYINDKGQLQGKVYNLELNEEYRNIRWYCKRCFEKQYFTYEQANRITKLIIKKYNILSEFLWDKFINYRVFRNPKYYYIMNAFNDTTTINWKQSNNIRKGDIIYIYIAEPYSAIMFKCEVIETGIPYKYKKSNVPIKQIMKIKLIKKIIKGNGVLKN